MRLSTLFKIFSNSLITHILYTCRFTLIFFMRDYFVRFYADVMLENVKCAIA